MAADITLKLTGIEGESKISGYEGEIDLTEFDFGVTQPTSGGVGHGSGNARADVHDVTVTKYLDKSSPILFVYSATGTHIPEAIMTVRKAGGTALDYLVVTLTDVVVSKVTTGGSSSDDRVTERVSLNFAQIAIQYKAQKPDGSADATIQKTYNVEQNCEV